MCMSLRARAEAYEVAMPLLGATREAPIIKMEHVLWRWLHLSQRIIDRYPSGTNSLISGNPEQIR